MRSHPVGRLSSSDAYCILDLALLNRDARDVFHRAVREGLVVAFPASLLNIRMRSTSSRLT